MTWPITWPAYVNLDGVDPIIKALAEKYAAASMHHLTLGRAGSVPVTISPAAAHRLQGTFIWWENWAEGTFYPGSQYPGLPFPSAEELKRAVTVRTVEAVHLPVPVGPITEVRVDGAVLDPSGYRVEDDGWLVRLSGEPWPAQGDNFTVTYLNAFPVGDLGAHAGGVMAAEWLKLFTKSKDCRISTGARQVSRQGITMDIVGGLFPGQITNIPEIDGYTMLLNPHRLLSRPRVWSPDVARNRQVMS